MIYHCIKKNNLIKYSDYIMIHDSMIKPYVEYQNFNPLLNQWLSWYYQHTSEETYKDISWYITSEILVMI